MADILLQLSQLSFDRIGYIEDVNDKWEVTGRPLTLNMNEIVQMANFPPQKLPSTAFPSSLDYFRALAAIHLTHLQRSGMMLYVQPTTASIDTWRAIYFSNWLKNRV